SWSSTPALAAVVPAGLMYWTLIAVLIGTVMYVNTFVAQYEGASRKDRVVASVWQGIYLSIIGGSVVLLFVPFSDSIFRIVGHDPAVQRFESTYFSILCFGAIPAILITALSAFYSGRGKTQVVMFVNFAIVGINIVLDYFLIFGIGPFPEWGIRGAATATVIAEFVGVGIFAVLLVREHNRHGYATLNHRRYDRELFRRLMRYGLPTGLQYLSDIAGFAVFIFLIGTIGTMELAATNLAFSLNMMAFIPMAGFGMAVMTLVGKRIGEGRPELAVRTTWMAFKICAVYMLAFAAVYLFLPDLILAPYAAKTSPAEFQELRELVVVLLRFVAIYSFLDGMAIIFGSAIRGAGDTRFSLLFTFIAGWSLMVLPTFVIWNWFDKNLFYAWTACSIYISTLGIGLLLRFQWGPWKSMRVIEPDPQGTPNVLPICAPDFRIASPSPERPTDATTPPHATKTTQP
ncbi:MAG: MATE family efflux transporter, partial [Planctomycetes bacterium]|nr:MATE family efflux transporter [Planctomycetota bacterium]